MGLFVIEFRTQKVRVFLIGAVFSWKKRAWELRKEAYRTTIALIRPQKPQEGVAFRLLGYDKISLAPTSTKEEV